MSGILGQIAPGALSLETAYTVPANTVASARVIVTNRSSIDATFRVALSPNGAAIDDAHYVAYDEPIEGNRTGATIGFVIGSADLVRVYASSADLSFTVTGETRAE